MSVRNEYFLTKIVFLNHGLPLHTCWRLLMNVDPPLILTVMHSVKYNSDVSKLLRDFEPKDDVCMFYLGGPIH